MPVRKKIIMGLLALGVLFGFGSGIARVAYGAGRCHSERGYGAHAGWGHEGRRGWGRDDHDRRGWQPQPAAPVAPAAAPAPAAPAAPATGPVFVIGVPYGAHYPTAIGVAPAPAYAPAPVAVAPAPVTPADNPAAE